MTLLWIMCLLKRNGYKLKGNIMKLFVLERLEPYYDEVTSMAVLAPTNSAARVLASEARGMDEDSNEWLDPLTSTCIEINSNKLGIVLVQTKDG